MNDSFYADFDKLIEFLYQGSNLGLVEQLVSNYLSDNQELSFSKFINFQLELSQVVQNHIGVIFHYFKQNVGVQYEGRHKEVYRRLERLKKIFSLHYTSMEGAMTNPNKLKGTLFTFNELYPHDLSVTLLKFDSTYFTLNIDINGGINLADQLIENLTNKLQQGNNNIDVNQYNQLVNKFELFSKLMEETTQKKESHVIE